MKMKILSFVFYHFILRVYFGEVIHFSNHGILATEQKSVYLTRENEITIPVLQPITITVREGKLKAQTTALIHVS